MPRRPHSRSVLPLSRSRPDESAVFNADSPHLSLSMGVSNSSSSAVHPLDAPLNNRSHDTTRSSRRTNKRQRHNHPTGGDTGGWYAQWKAQREARVVQRSRAAVDAYVSAVVAQSRRFLETTPDQPIPRFLRNEVVCGKLLGSGMLARVFDITDLDLQEDLDDRQPPPRDRYDSRWNTTTGTFQRTNNTSNRPNQNNNNNTMDDDVDDDMSMSHERTRLRQELEDIEEISQRMQDDSLRLHQRLSLLYEAEHSDHDTTTADRKRQPRKQETETSGASTPPFSSFRIKAKAGRSVRFAAEPPADNSDNLPPENAIQVAMASTDDDLRTLETLSTGMEEHIVPPHLLPFQRLAKSLATTVASKMQLMEKRAQLEAATSKLGSNIVRLVETDMRNNPATASFRATPPSRISMLLLDMADSQRQLVERKTELEASLLRVEARDWLRSKDHPLALKHLTKHLLRDPKSFYLAAAALLIEAKYLSKMNHPNIISIKGLPMSATTAVEGGDDEGIQSGQYDAYFFMMPRLTDVLERRIRQWRKEAGTALLPGGGVTTASVVKTHSPRSEKTPSQKIQTWQLMKRKTNYALQVANAINYLHDRKLLYRDLKPMNIGFIGDNHTIQIFNFGCCRELDPVTGKVTTDDVSDFVSSLTHRYTAPECFPKEHHSSSSTASLSSLSWTSKRSSRKKNRSSISGNSSKSSRNGSSIVKFEPDEGVDDNPEFDLRVDVYSWAMVYYELLTLEQPYARMSIQEFKETVCGVYSDKPNIYLEGAKRPGVYQHDLLPSMISLLHRAWEQLPSKRPSMESICKNLVTITHELEFLIRREQIGLKHEIKDLCPVSRDSLIQKTSYEGGARNATAPVAPLTSKKTPAAKSKPQHLQQKGKKILVTVTRAPALAASAFSTDHPPKNGDGIPGPDALEYENWDDPESSSESESASDASSITDELGYTPDTHENTPPACVEEVEEEEEEVAELDDDDVAGFNLQRKRIINSQSISRGRRMLQSVIPSERRTTNRKSRRTISGLSRASLLYMRIDWNTIAKLLVVILLALGALRYVWMSFRRTTDNMSFGPDMEEVRYFSGLLDVDAGCPVMDDECRRDDELPSPPQPRLFKLYPVAAGSSSPVDLDSANKVDAAELNHVSKIELEDAVQGISCGFLKLCHCHNFNVPLKNAS